MENCRGYTVIEALIALSIFVAVVVPLMQRMYISAKINRGKDKMVASCIIEQETALLYTFPDRIFTSKSRTINRKKWTVKAYIKGDKLKKVELKVYKKKKFVEKAKFYIYKHR